MFKTADCERVSETVYDFLEKKLPADERRAIDEHLRGCASCREELRRIQAVRGLVGGSLEGCALSSDFATRTGKRLHAITTGQQALAGSGVYDEEEADVPVPAAAGGFLESLSAQFGAAPWWIISGAFHALLILLVFLIGMVVMQAKQNDMVIVTNLEKQEKPPEPEKKLERDVIEKPVVVQETEIVSDQQPIVTHEVVEFAETAETADESDAHDAKGEDGISDIWLGGTGTVGSIGVGGGGRAGAFGRPGSAGGRLKRAAAGGGGKATESAVDKGLEWLAKHQEADGRWDTAKYGAGRKMCDTAITALAVLAFLGAGHTEKVGKYKDNVQRGVKWLIAQQQADGSLKPSHDAHNMGYTNAMAGMALAESAAMARVPETKEAAQKSINYAMEKHQVSVGNSEKQGYRYRAQQAGDISNGGWYIMQLKSAKVAGLHVDPAAFEGMKWFLDQVEDKGFKKDANDPYDNGRHRYGYTNATQIAPRRTAIGCLGRLFMGSPPDEVRGGVEWFVKAGGVPRANKWDLYYWYYGTLCTFQAGGDAWKQWNEALKATLLPAQRNGGDEDGSWDPTGHYGDCWGRVGSTALSVLCLEVYYRYLPMYRE